MVVGYIDPNSDVIAQWQASGINHDHVDDGIREPNVPNSDDIDATDGDENAVDHYHMTTLEGIDEATKIVVWVYGRGTSGEQAICNARIDDELYLGAWTCTNTTFAWRSHTYNGSWTQSDIDGLQIRFTADSNYGKYDGTWIRACYMEITYSEVSLGYGHDFLGVPAENIDNVSGVPTANIDKIKGV